MREDIQIERNYVHIQNLKKRAEKWVRHTESEITIDSFMEWLSIGTIICKHAKKTTTNKTKKTKSKKNGWAQNIMKFDELIKRFNPIQSSTIESISIEYTTNLCCSCCNHEQTYHNQPAQRTQIQNECG